MKPRAKRREADEEGFSAAEAWTGARACRHCARYSDYGHSPNCVFTEVKRLRKLLRAAERWMIHRAATISGVPPERVAVELDRAVEAARKGKR